MRTTSADIPVALSKIGIEAKVRITAYKSRIFFDDTDLVNEVYSPTLAPIITDSDVAYPISDTQSVHFCFDEGAVRISYVDASSGVHSSPGRIFDPICVLSTDDATQLLNAGAAILGDKVFCYFSRYDGAVQGIYYQLAEDGINGTWSDFFIAIPEDLSGFDITSVFTYNNRIFMTGIFYRKSQFQSDSCYTIFTYSDNGLTFSLDRRVMVTLVDQRFSSRFEEDTNELVFFSDTQTYRTDAPYQIIGEDADSIVVPIRNLSGSVVQGWSVDVVSGKEEYYTNVLVDESAFAKLEIGIATENQDPEWVKYHDVIIAAVDRKWADGNRLMNIQLQADGPWHTSVMTHPYYMEWQGKQYYQSPMRALDLMTNVDSGGGQRWSLAQDLSNASDPEGYTDQTHAGSTTTDTWANDILESGLSVAYPVFEDATDYEIRIYGWSRAGVPSQNPNVADDTPTNTNNDEFYGLLLVQDLTGNTSTIVTTLDKLTSDHTNPPQTWFEEGARDGSFPVIFNVSNPGQGWKILKLGVRVISDNGNTTYYLSRIEMPGVVVEYVPDSTLGFTVVDNQAVCMQKGVPQVLQSYSVFNTWNFDLAGRFKIVGPYTYAGLLGLCTDKDNYLAGYVRPGYIGIAKIRYGVRTTVVEQSASISDGNTYDIRFWHRDGLFGMEYKATDAVAWPQRGSILSYEWTTADGALTYEAPVIATAPEDLNTDASGSYIYHTGIWAIIDPPKFRTQGFFSSGNTIPVMPCDTDPETGSSAFDAFPSSGQITCADYKYSFSGKNEFFASDQIRGPFQLRAILDWNGYNTDLYDSYHYSGIRAVEYFDFAWISDADNHDLFNGAVVCSDTGYTWGAAECFFKPWVTTGGVVVLQLERMRLYGTDDIIPEGANQETQDRIWLTNGLTGVSLIDSTKPEVTHLVGSFIYIDHDDAVTCYGFMGASGHEDNSIEGLLDKVCRISGTQAKFPGDNVIATSSLNDGDTVSV